MCRCTGYENIIKAVKAGAEAMDRKPWRGKPWRGKPWRGADEGLTAMDDFNYHEPRTLDEAAAACARHRAACSLPAACRSFRR